MENVIWEWKLLQFIYPATFFFLLCVSFAELNVLLIFWDNAISCVQVSHFNYISLVSCLINVNKIKQKPLLFLSSNDIVQRPANEMSDESPTKRLSQIFGSLSCLSDIKATEAVKKDPSKDNHVYTKQLPFNFAQTSSPPPPSSLPSSSSSTQSGRTAHISNIPTSRVLIGSRSTPNSPRLMPKRSRVPPAVPQRPNASAVAPNPALAALDTEAPWPHFSTLTDHLDVHQVNNYNQGLPEINWQERCLELQLELHRSKSQAGRIRDMLGDKVSTDHYFVIER